VAGSPIFGGTRFICYDCDEIDRERTYASLSLGDRGVTMNGRGYRVGDCLGLLGTAVANFLIALFHRPLLNLQADRGPGAGGFSPITELVR
jgi:hypothetical protein